MDIFTGSAVTATETKLATSLTELYSSLSVCAMPTNHTPLVAVKALVSSITTNTVSSVLKFFCFNDCDWMCDDHLSSLLYIL